ncbi:MAG: LA_3659 family protein [Bullifex sp.]
MMVYILPVALFVITLIIILALRAEDKKSRSLQNVKEKITNFRNEATQTTKRVQETCHDSIDKIQAKEDEAQRVIADIAASLDSLTAHRHDLAALESICRSYEVTLEKLRLQTEHAENRISVVQDEVRKAEAVNMTIESFKADAARIEEETVRQQEAVKAYLAGARETLDSIAGEHQEKEREMLSLFSDELSRNREEFGAYLDEAKAASLKREEEAGNALAECLRSMDEKQSAIMTGIDSRLGEIEEKKDSLSALFDERERSLSEEQERLSGFYESKDREAEAMLERYRGELAEEKAGLDRYFDEKAERIRAISDEMVCDAAARKSETEAFFEEEKGKAGAFLSSSIEAIEEKERSAEAAFLDRKASLDEELRKNDESALNARTNLSVLYTSLEEKLNAVFASFTDSLRKLEEEVRSEIENLSRSRDLISGECAQSRENIEKFRKETEENIGVLVSDTERKLSEAAGENIRALDARCAEAEERSRACEASLREVHRKETELITAESASFRENNRQELVRILSEEMTRIDGVYRAMNSVALETISNLSDRQSAIKESVSLLHQGADETIANTVERLNDLQRRLDEKQNQLEETQKRVTETKEELFNLTERNKSVSQELTRLADRYDDEKNKLDDVKRERLEEEAKLERKQASGPADEFPTQARSRKASVVIQAFPEDLLGEEEDILDGE